jgi:2,5-diketo-D-gluconate reductase A
VTGYNEAMSQVPNIRLNNGVQIPQFGFGVFQIEPARTAQVVRTAFDAGYRQRGGCRTGDPGGRARA